MHKLQVTAFAAASALAAAISAAPVMAACTTQQIAGHTFACWMSPDISSAWQQSYIGQGTTILFVDDFSSSDAFSGNFNGTTQTQIHGLWTTEEAGMVAPGATINKQDFNSEVAITLAPTGLNIVNNSYGIIVPARLYKPGMNWNLFPQEQSIIAAAQNGTAVVSKSSGNDGIAIGTAKNRKTDIFNNGLADVALANNPNASVIFVGALTTNGTTSAKAVMASYSDFAGSNPLVQSHFLSVGVTDSLTGLAGTSFSAPIISGYAAILGSKFTTATPTAITNQLLATARTDTIKNYTAAKYGKGEASLSRALAPVSIH
jgi:subtilisin family serine protease